MSKTPLFHKGHYNILAAKIKKHLFTTYPDKVIHSRSMLHFTLELTERLQEDNPAFDPLKFLDACSLDSDQYPLSELWEDYINGS